MDAFESIVAIFLDSMGYWVKQSVKVTISKEEKKLIGSSAMPTPEIDLVAYNPKKDELILIEVKSFLDSGGVEEGGVKGTNEKTKSRYRLLNNATYQNIISNKLRQLFIEKGFITQSTVIKYALAAGNVDPKSYTEIKNYLDQKGYYFYEPSEIQKAILKLQSSVYLNDSVTMTVKLLKSEFKK